MFGILLCKGPGMSRMVLCKGPGMSGMLLTSIPFDTARSTRPAQAASNVRNTPSEGAWDVKECPCARRLGCQKFSFGRSL